LTDIVYKLRRCNADRIIGTNWVPH